MNGGTVEGVDPWEVSARERKGREVKRRGRPTGASPWLGIVRIHGAASVPLGGDACSVAWIGGPAMRSLPEDPRPRVSDVDLAVKRFVLLPLRAAFGDSGVRRRCGQ